MRWAEWAVSGGLVLACLAMQAVAVMPGERINISNLTGQWLEASGNCSMLNGSLIVSGDAELGEDVLCIANLRENDTALLPATSSPEPEEAHKPPAPEEPVETASPKESSPQEPPTLASEQQPSLKRIGERGISEWPIIILVFAVGVGIMLFIAFRMKRAENETGNLPSDKPEAAPPSEPEHIPEYAEQEGVSNENTEFKKVAEYNPQPDEQSGKNGIDVDAFIEKNNLGRRPNDNLNETLKKGPEDVWDDAKLARRKINRRKTRK